MAIDQDAKRLAMAIRQQESGGNYQAKGQSGEYGAYQFMPETWKSSAKQVLGDANAEPTRENQNKVAYTKIKTWKDQGYKPDQIASLWNHGKPEYEGVVGTNKQGVHYDTPSYVKNVYAHYNKLKQEEGALNARKQRVDTASARASQGTATGPEQPSQFSKDHPILSGIGDAVGGFLKGAIKGVGSTLSSAEQLGEGALNKASETLFPSLGIKGSDKTFGQQQKETTFKPYGTAQKAGFGAEQLGEMFIPIGGEVKGLSEGAKAVQAAEKVPNIYKAARFGAKALSKGVESGLEFAGKTALQTGDLNQAKQAGIVGLGAGAAGEAIGAAGRAIAPKLSESAARTYTEALAPTTKETKAITQKVVPELLKRRVGAMTRGGLMSKFSTGAEGAGEKIGEIIDSIPKDTPVNLKSMVEQLEKAKSEFMVPGGAGEMVAADPEAVAHLDGFKNILQQMGFSKITAQPFSIGVADEAPIENVRKLRQIWDKSIAQSKGFFGKTVSEGSKLAAQKEASNAIRSELGKQFPNLDKANKEFSFWKNAEKVLGESIQKKAGQGSGLGGIAAEAAGTTGELAKSGSIVDSFLVGKVFKALASATKSTGWKTYGAITKSRIANLLSQGKAQEALDLIAKLGVGATNRK